MAHSDFNTYNIENYTERASGRIKSLFSTIGGFALKMYVEAN